MSPHRKDAKKPSFNRALSRRSKRGASALAGALALLALASSASAFNAYPAPIQVSFAEMGRAVATSGGLSFVGADTYGNDLWGSNSGDDYIGAAFLFAQGNPNPLQVYYGDSNNANLGLDTAMTNQWLAAASDEPPTVHLAAGNWGNFPSDFTQEIVIAGAHTAGPAIDMTPQFLVVGLEGFQGNPNYDVGQVLVYSYNYWAGLWGTTPTALIPNGGTTDPDYGASVAIEGNRVIVGSPGAGGMGAVYIFERNTSGQWQQVYQGTPRLSSGGGTYGADVDIHGDYAIVNDPSASITKGYVHFLTRSSSGWVSADYVWPVKASDVTISNNKAALGFFDSNEVTTYQRNGSSWSQMGGFYPNDFNGIGAGVSLDGDFLAMGAPSYSEGNESFKGALFTANIWESYNGFSF